MLTQSIILRPDSDGDKFNWICLQVDVSYRDQRSTGISPVDICPVLSVANYKIHNS